MGFLILEKIRNHSLIHIFLLVICVAISITFAYYPNLNAWKRYIDEKEVPLDEKGKDFYYVSLSFSLMSFLIGLLWIYIHIVKKSKSESQNHSYQSLSRLINQHPVNINSDDDNNNYSTPNSL